MSETAPVKQPGLAQSNSPFDQESAESIGGSQSFSPPPFSVSAGTEEDTGSQNPIQATPAGPQQTPLPPVEPQTLAPPPLNLTASPMGEQEGGEEELVEQEEKIRPNQFDDGSVGEDGSSEDNPEENASSPIQMLSRTRSAPASGGNSSQGLGQQSQGTSATSGEVGIIPPLKLFGENVDIDLTHVKNTTTLSINLNLVEGAVATSIEVVIEEGAFVSGKLLVESSYLTDIILEVLIDAEGNIAADFSLEDDILGFPTTVLAQLTPDGIAGSIEMVIPPGHALVAGLTTTGGSIFFNFGEEGSVLRGNLAVATDDGLATGTAAVEVDLKTGKWSGDMQMHSQGREINVAPGVDILLPEGFDFSAIFGSEEGLVLEGSATVVPQVTLISSESIEAAGTAELELSLGASGLDFILNKVRLAISGGLNAPDIEEMLESQHLTSDVDAGAILTLHFDNNALTRMDLEATGGISTGERRIGRLSFAGQAGFNPFHFIGMLHGVTNASVTLIEGNRFTTSLMPGSQFFLSLDNAGVTNLDASLGLEVADQESTLAQLRVASSIPRGQGLSLAATLELMRRLNLATVEQNGFGLAVLPTAGLSAQLENGALTEIAGSLPVEVADQDGELLAGNLEGRMAMTEEGEGVSLQDGLASATLLRDLSMELGAGEVKVLEGASMSARFEGGTLVSLAGNISALYNNGSRIINITAEIDYDPSQKILRSLDASLATGETFHLFDGKLQISEIEGGISVRNDEVVSLGGHARLDAFVGDFVMAGEADVTWSNEGDENTFIGSGWLEFSWYEEEESHRYLNGRVDATIDGENFSLLGQVEVGLMEGLSGKASVSMDQEMDPEISASLTYNAVLMEASELWAMEFGLGIYVPIFPGITIEAGILFGMAINSRPLMVMGTVGVENWRPKSGNFPDFFAELRASWGLDIEAKAMAYLELILGIDGLLHLTGGISAGVGLNIPIEMAPHIALHGGEDGVWGEMGLDLSINPILKLLVDAYLKWGVLGIWDGEKVWNLMDQELAELGNIDWSGSFAFGDKQEPSGNAPAADPQQLAPQGAPISTPAGLNGDSSLGYGNNQEEPASEAGLTGLTDGLNVPTQQDQESEMDQDGLGQEFGKVGQYAAGVTAVADLIKILADGFQSFLKGGPIGLLIWLLFKKPSKEEINEKRDKVQEFRQTLSDEQLIEAGSTIDLMLGILSGDYSIWIIFDKSKPYRDMVDEGMHEDATLEDRSKILEGMIKGWTGEKDETRILKVLDYTLSNEGGAGVREMTELVGGPKRVRDQYESFLGQDRDDRRELDRIFTASYGSNWGDNPDVSNRPTYTAEEGAFVKRSGRTWEELAEQAFGHSSYVVYLLNFPYNASQMSAETAYNDYQQNNNNNNNNNGGGIPDPDDFEDGMFDPGNMNNGNTYNGPPVPQFQARIPTKAEVVNMHAAGVWQERFQIPGVIEHAHWFENFEMIALFAYGNANYKHGLRSHNPGIPEIEEGMTITLPSAADLGPPWIEVAPVAIGSTGFKIWISPDSNQVPAMWIGSPDRLVTELAQEALEFESTATAGEELMRVTNFNGDTTQTDAENAISVANNLIDFVLASGLGGEPATGFEDASPGDTLRLSEDQLPVVAETVYGHVERAAWIVAFNTNKGDHPGSMSHTSAKGKSSSKTINVGMLAANTSAGNGLEYYTLPNWSEMSELDPLPAAVRGIAPKSVIETMDGDTWSNLAVKAYGNWELAIKLAEYSANEGMTMSPGTQITLPRASELSNGFTVAAEAASHAAVSDGPEGGTSTTDTVTDNRDFSPGKSLIVKAGDTWSSIATATYSDFSLFVRLANHPLNVPFKTLPEGAEIYLPTVSELQDVPEFGLGLSPTGFPLLTEMVRIPTDEELHHVWVENRAAEGAEPDGVWMMASKAFKLTPKVENLVQETQDNPDMLGHAQDALALTQGDQTAEAIIAKKGAIRALVEHNLLASKFEDTVGISASVGEGGRNKPEDVSVVQRFLVNANLLQERDIDGKVGDQTIQAIETFQQQRLGWHSGLVEVNSNTWNELKTWVPMDGDYYRGDTIDEMGVAGGPKHQYSTMIGPGARLYEKPTGTAKSDRVKFGETVRVLCYEATTNPQWIYVINEKGGEGWINKEFIEMPKPASDATLMQVTANGFSDILSYYESKGYSAETGFDDRHILVGLAMANEHMGAEAGAKVDQGMYQQHLDDNTIFNLLHNQGQNNAIYNSLTIREGANVWLYSWQHIQGLRESGVIATRPEFTNDMIDFANEFVEYDQLKEFITDFDVVFGAIKTDPALFIEKLMEAVMGGFQQFGENAEEHIFSGVTDWLLGDPNLKFPNDPYDVGGYATLALDVLDLNLEEELKRVVNNDDLFYQAKDGLDWVYKLLEEGPGAVWNELGSELNEVTEEIKTSLIGELKEFARNKIILEAGKRLAAMFVPGAGILVALKSLWDVVKSLYEQAEKIVEMLRVITAAMADVAQGNYATAKDNIESGLASISSILIGTLFDFLNLGGIRDRIRSFLDKIRNKIVGMIDKIADYVKEKLNLFSNQRPNENLGIAGGNEDGEMRPVLSMPTVIEENGNSVIEASQLTEEGLSSGKSRSNYDVDGWDHAANCNAEYDEWVRAHKISHRLGGPGEVQAKRNLFISSKKANGDFERKAEKPAQNALRWLVGLKPTDSLYNQYKDKVMYYRVNYNMWTGASHLNGFVRDATFEWGYVSVQGNTVLHSTRTTDPRSPVTISSKAPQANPTQVIYDINSAGWDTLWNKTNKDEANRMKSNFWQNVTKLRNLPDTDENHLPEPYDSVMDLEWKLLNWGDKTVSDDVVREQCEILEHYIDNNTLRFY